MRRSVLKLKGKDEEDVEVEQTTTTGLFDFSDDEEEDAKKDQESSDFSDNEEHLEEDTESKASDVSDDDDDAPEDVSFHAGKEKAMAEIRDILEVIKSDKQQLKQKRKKTELLYKAQKKQRLEYLAKRRLPDEVVASLKTPVLKKKRKEQDHVSDEGSIVEPPTNEDEEIVVKPSLLARGADFLPLDTSRPHARTLRDVRKVERSSKAALLEFRHTALYGGRIPRQSMKATLAQKEKRKVAKTQSVPTR